MRRWLGNIRFTLGALHQVWQQRRYAARVAVYPADPAPPPSPKPPAAAPDLRTDSAQNEPGYAEHDQALQGDSPYQPPRHMRTALGGAEVAAALQHATAAAAKWRQRHRPERAVPAGAANAYIGCAGRCGQCGP